jgi:hypothetical protein
VAWIGGLQDLDRTTNGGLTWTIERPSNTDWFAINFLDSENGWAGGQDQDIDDVPGSIWKRTGANPVLSPQGQAASVIRSPIWAAPPSFNSSTNN